MENEIKETKKQKTWRIVIAMVFLTLVGVGMVIADGGIGIGDDKPSVKSETSYSYFTRDVKAGKSHNLTFAPEFEFINITDRDWVSKREALSLKEAYDLGLIGVNVKENDEKYQYIINDLNYTYIDIKPILTSKADLNKDIPITITDVSYRFNETTGEVSEERNVVLSSSFNYADLSNSQSVTKNFDNSIFGKEIKIGNASTIIELTCYSGGGILEDAYYDQDGAEDTKYLIFDSTADGTGEVPIIKFNISSIPAGATIDNATIQFYIYDSGGNPSNFDIYDSLNQSWRDDQIDSLSNVNDVYNMYNEKIISSSISGAYGVQDNATDWQKAVQNSLDAGLSNCTISFNKTGSTSYYKTVYAKESSQSETQKPWITIEYTESTETQCDDYSGAGNYIINCSACDYVSSDDYILINNPGTDKLVFCGDNSESEVEVRTNITGVYDLNVTNCKVKILKPNMITRELTD